MTEKEIRRIVREEMEKMQSELAEKPVSSWAEKFWNNAKALGIVDGSRPCSTVTRQEAVTMILKASSCR